MLGKSHQIVLTWANGRRASIEDERRGKEAALKALDAGVSPKQAMAICLSTMFSGRQMLFDGLTIAVDGEQYGISTLAQ